MEKHERFAPTVPRPNASGTPEAEAPAARIGDFVVRAILGEGGMGTVYEAFDTKLSRVVAIKIPHAGAITSARLVEEAKALASLRHPGLVTVHALGEHEGLPYVVMERIQGTTLASYLDKRHERGEEVSLSEALDLLLPIAEVLSIVHRAGLAHRDVKPSNVMISPGGRIVLMDFGLFQTDTPGDARIAAAGTPQYIAPETVSASVEERLGHLVDVYALGCVAYELFTGAPPFDGEQPSDVFAAHVNDAPPKLRDKRPEVPEAIASLVDRMLAKDPVDRPHDMESVAWALRRARASVAEPTKPFGVLVVDDDEAIAKMIELRIRRAVPGARVERARDPIEAIDRLASFQPDMLVLDLQMPRMSGVELAMYLKSTPFFERCVGVAISAGASDTDRELLRQLGITRFVAKGTDFGEKLLAHVRELAHDAR